MKLVLHELYKQLSGRILWLVMALLVLLNVIFCFREIDKDYYADQLAALKMAETVVKANPEEVYLRYQTMLSTEQAYSEESNKWNELNMEAMMGLIPFDELPPEPESPEFPATYYEGWDDFRLLDLYYDQTLTSDEYINEIEEKRKIAEDTVNEYRASGYSSESYAYRYQVRFWNVYGEALELVKPNDSVSYGWDAFWKYDGSGIFLLLAAILIGSRLFIVERDSGMESVLRTARRGRGQLALAKLGCAALWMLGISLLFHLSALLACASRYGLSSPFAPLQQSTQMLYCPYPLSQIGAFLLTVLVSALATLVICLFTASLTLLLKRALPAIALSAVIVGVEFYLIETGGEYLASINLLTATNAMRLWSRWSPIHFMGRPQSFLPVMLIVFAVIVLLVGLIALERWVRHGMGAGTIRFALPKLNVKWKLPQLRPHFHSVRLFGYELHKLSGIRMALICLLLIVIQVVISLNSLNGEPTFYDEMKSRYMQEYDRLSLDETDSVISERLAVYAEATREGKASEMAAKRISDEITYEEYAAYCDLLNEALSHKETLNAYREEIRYLIEKRNETGVETRPVLSTGFVTWAKRPFDIPVIVLLFVLLAGVFAREHESKFIYLLRTTRRGRRPVWSAKLRMAVFCSIAVTLCAMLFDVVLLVTRYPTDFLTAPLFCITRYKNVTSSITAEEYLLLVCLLRLMGTLLWGLVITALSQLLRSEWAAAGCMLLTFLPYGLTLLGVPSAERFDITMLLSGDRLWLLSWEQGSVTLLLVFTAAAAALTAGLTVASYRKFCK